MFESVHTVTNYYDGPRRGIADYRGVPHLYESRWSDIDTDTVDTFLLMPIESELFELALQDWAIWRRWEIAFHEGRTSADTHPALAEDRTRHIEIDDQLKARLMVDESKTFCAKGIFEVREEEHHEPGLKPLVVEWTLVSCDDYIQSHNNRFLLVGHCRLADLV